jgi:hypothetical protein
MMSAESPERGGEKKGDSSSNLLGLFDPPPALDEEKSSKERCTPALSDDEGKYEDDDGNNDNLDDSRNTNPENVDNDAPGSLSHFMSLFAPPSSPPSKIEKPALVDRQSTVPRSNRSSQQQLESTPLLESSKGLHTPQSSFDWRESTQMIMSMMGADTPKTGSRARVEYNTTSATNPQLSKSHTRLLSSSHVRMPSATMPPISEGKPQNIVIPELDSQHAASQDFSIISGTHNNRKDIFKDKMHKAASSTINALQLPRTYIGSFMYLLYHVVFCLALGSAIMRPNNPTSVLGLMTKTAALGTVAASPVYWMNLSQEVPALYPTADLFLAPFLAGLALIVDQTLASDSNVSKEENDAIFLATFGVLTTIGILLSAALLVAASVFKLANLGSFLPFPVICGFFSAVGILTWTLAVNVDTDGKSIGVILTSGDTGLILFAVIHHAPTVLVAGFMKYLGPKNPFYVVMVVCVTIGLFYAYMFVTGTSLGEMKEAGWFWSHDELVYKSSSGTMRFEAWAPPAPFGVLMELHRVHWGAVRDGLKTAIALSFLYLIRCSV